MVVSALFFLYYVVHTAQALTYFAGDSLEVRRTSDSHVSEHGRSKNFIVFRVEEKDQPTLRLAHTPQHT